MRKTKQDRINAARSLNNNQKDGRTSGLTLEDVLKRVDILEINGRFFQELEIDHPNLTSRDCPWNDPVIRLGVVSCVAEMSHCPYQDESIEAEKWQEAYDFTLRWMDLDRRTIAKALKRMGTEHDNFIEDLMHEEQEKLDRLNLKIEGREEQR